MKQNVCPVIVNLSRNFGPPLYEYEGRRPGMRAGVSVVIAEEKWNTAMRRRGRD